MNNELNLLMKHVDFYMKIALETARLSRAYIAQVGCIAVKENRIISIGYNGTPNGWSNACEICLPPSGSSEAPFELTQEIHEYVPSYLEQGWKIETKPEVLHAEANCLMKIACSHETSQGATLFTTRSPCISCAKMIYQAGVGSVYFHSPHSNRAGVDFLERCNVPVVDYLKMRGPHAVEI